MDKKSKDDLLKEIADIKNLMSHLGDEYRKSNISEKYYQELKEKYSQKLGELEKRLGSKEEVAEEEKDDAEENSEEVEKEEKKPKAGIFGKILGKKDKPQEAKQEKVEKKKEKAEEEKEIEVGEVEEMTPEVIEKLAQQVAQGAGVTGTESKEEANEEAPEGKEGTSKDIEIEKLKVMIDAVRDAKRATDETIQTISESIGEIRSMAFQTDTSFRETSLKLEKIEDEISEVKPKEIDMKFKEISGNIEKFQMQIEKFDKKSEDLATKVNEVYKILKGIGGIENLVNLNKDIQKKIEDMKEALKYTERIAFKTEKSFIDLNKSLEEFDLYKRKQEGLDEMTKDLMKTVDGMNARLDSFLTKKDLEMFRGDILVLQKQVEEINKILPVVQAKLPETITSFRKEKEDILLFLDSLEQNLKAGGMTIGEYEAVRKKNLNKLVEIESKLMDEWDKIKESLEKGEIPKEEKPVKESKPKRKKVEKVEEEEAVEKEVAGEKQDDTGEKSEEVEEEKTEEVVENVEEEEPEEAEKVEEESEPAVIKEEVAEVKKEEKKLKVAKIEKAVEEKPVLVEPEMKTEKSEISKGDEKKNSKDEMTDILKKIKEKMK